MRRIVVAGAMTASGLVLLMSYPTSTGGGLVGAAPGTSSAGGSASGSAGSSGGGGPSAGTPSAGGSTSPSAGSGTITGASVGTEWGNVQVEIKVENGQVVDARAVEVPQGTSMDQQINSYAVPILQDETVQVGSSHIDAVSGATVTSMGYIESLQSALDQAGLR
jgi:uncharacterized protein with FMN-binding domain